jgi:hypothetical protein
MEGLGISYFFEKLLGQGFWTTMLIVGAGSFVLAFAGKELLFQ